MDELRSQRAAELRQMLHRYPRAASAPFNEENDHNPDVLEDCPDCGGSGLRRFDQSLDLGPLALHAHADADCPTCLATGITGRVLRYFQNERPPRDAEAADGGTVTCPHCRRRFATSDGRAWTGWRHVYCGQRLRIVAARRRA